MDAEGICPECGGKFVWECRCPLGHFGCAQGHEWHRCLVHDRKIAGPANHGRDVRTCLCPQERDEASGGG